MPVSISLFVFRIWNAYESSCADVRLKLFQLPAEKYLVHAAALRRQDSPLADAAELVEVSRPVVVVKIAPRPMRQGDIPLIMLLRFIEIKLAPRQDSIRKDPNPSSIEKGFGSSF